MPGDPPPPTLSAAPLYVLNGGGPGPALPPMEGSLPFFYDLYTFRGDEGETRVVASFAVPAGRLREVRGDDDRYLFDVTVALTDAVTGLVRRTDDSVTVVLSPRPPEHHLLHTDVQVDMPPSENVSYRVVMIDAATPGIGQLYHAPFPIPDYSGDTLMISDIALGLPGVDGGWTRGDVTLALLPTGLLPQQSFEVFYETYNLTSGTPYQVEITIEALEELGAGTGVERARLRFTDRAPAEGGTIQDLRWVDTRLDTGLYRLTVMITDGSDGRSATRSRLFRVRGWPPGATLVPAAPRNP